MRVSPDPIRPYLNAIKWAVLALLLAGWGWYWFDRGTDKWQGRYDAERAAHVQSIAGHAAVRQRLAEATAAVAAKARAASTALADARMDNDNRYNEKVEDAKQARGDLAAALHRGDVQLQPWWQCGATTGSGTDDDAALAGDEDAAAELRYQDAAAATEDADLADAWIGWLQSELTSTRHQVIAAGCAVEAAP